MMKLASFAAVAVLSATALTACGGGNDDKSFSEQAKSAADKAGNLSADDIAQKFQDLADSAPAELEDDFNTLGDVNLGDISNLDPSKAPDLQKAATDISDYIDDKC